MKRRTHAVRGDLDHRGPAGVIVAATAPNRRANREAATAGTAGTVTG
ncbi:hypothetical protein [Streptomyces sp. NPDC057257]